MLNGKNIISLAGVAIGISYILLVAGFIAAEGIPGLILGNLKAPPAFIVLFLAGSFGFVFSFIKKHIGVFLMIGSSVVMFAYLIFTKGFTEIKSILLLCLPLIVSGITRHYTIDKAHVEILEKHTL